MSMDMDFDFSAILQVFLAECEENLAAMEDACLALESRPDDAELVATIFRVVHTLKGDAGSLGLAHVAEFAHRLEDLLDLVREGAMEVRPDVAELLLRSVDALREMVPAAADGADALTAAQHGLLDALHLAAEPRVDAIAARAGTPAPGEAVSDPGEAAAARAAAARAGRSRTLRVDVDKLDRALDLVGEIAIARGRLTQVLEEGRPAAEVLEVHREADRLHVELQDAVMKLRMVPLGPVLRPHLRTVRDVAHATDKQARLVLVGEDVEVDTGLVEMLRDPLAHMIRNAVDHGIEAPGERAAAGKPPEGTITVHARHDAGSVVVSMSDDGAGLDRARILARARERGLAGEGADRMPDADVLRLIFEPGFSTAAAVTGLSGRGVGLDVVRRNVEALRGSVSVESTPGRGTTLTLRLPLTLAVIEGFSLGVGAETYIVPLDSVIECMELPAARHEADGGGVIDFRGAPLPFLRLADFLGVDRPRPSRENVVVVRHGEGRAGLVVDALFGESQAVIKPLGRLFQELAGVAGSTILGSGMVALILDVPAVVGAAAMRSDTHGAAAAP